MLRPAAQSLLRSSKPALPRRAVQLRAARRHISTAPPHQQSRSWRSSAARWGLAGAGVYWYNTSTVFAEEPIYPASRPATEDDNQNLPTIDDLAAARRARIAASAASSAEPTLSASSDSGQTSPATPNHQSTMGVGALEEEADEQGAFNPETGEINWDCPCLGGMAHGPCGDEFRAAFSCFVYSKEEPKGMDCIDRFRGMQDCFRLHPDVYGEELADDGEDEGVQGQEGQRQQEGIEQTGPMPAHAATSGAATVSSGQMAREEERTETAPREETREAPRETHGESVGKEDPRPDVPEPWHDSTGDNNNKTFGK